MPSPSPIYIRGTQVTDDPWIHLDDEATVPATGDVSVSLARYQKEGDALRQRQGRLALRLGVADEVTDAASALEHVEMIAVDIPKFADGRYFSIARLLRQRHGWKGELRARGDVLPDQIFFMHRCGFDAYELRGDKKAESALAALSTFSETYQGGIDEPRPLFLRRG